MSHSILQYCCPLYTGAHNTSYGFSKFSVSYVIRNITSNFDNPGLESNMAALCVITELKLHATLSITHLASFCDIKCVAPTNNFDL